MLNLAKRIAFAIDALACRQSGAAQVITQIVVAVFAVAMAVFTTVLCTEPTRRHEVLIARAHRVVVDGARAPS